MNRKTNSMSNESDDGDDGDSGGGSVAADTTITDLNNDLDTKSLMVYKESKPLGSRQWSSEARKDAKVLVRALDTGYLKLAQLLYEIHDTPMDGDPKNLPIYQVWGFDTFAQYVETELGIHHKKAESLRNIWYAFKHRLNHIPSEAKDRLAGLGWTKVRSLIAGTRQGDPGVLDMSNSPEWVDKWIQLASEIPLTQLEESIHTTKKEYQQRLATARTAAATQTVDLDGFMNSSDEELARSVESADGGPPRGIGIADIKVSPVPMNEIPNVERFIRETFSLVEEQHEVVKQAIGRASQISNSDKKSHNLSLICLEFLATNEFTRPDLDELPRFLARLEEQLEVKLVALHPKAKKVVYGAEAMDDMTRWFD